MPLVNEGTAGSFVRAGGGGKGGCSEGGNGVKNGVKTALGMADFVGKGVKRALWGRNALKMAIFWRRNALKMLLFGEKLSENGLFWEEML